MRKCDKVKANCYIDDGSWRTKNVKFRFYRLLHEAIRESHGNSWTTKKRYKRTVVINNCAYIPLNDVLYQLSKRPCSDLFFGNIIIPMDSVKEIRIF